MKNFKLLVAVLLLSNGAVVAQKHTLPTGELAAKASKALSIARKDIKDEKLCILLRNLTWLLDTDLPKAITDAQYRLNHLRQLSYNEESLVEQDYQKATLASMRLCGNEVTQSLFKDLTKDWATQVLSLSEYTTCPDARVALKRLDRNFAQIKTKRENYDKIEAVLNELSNQK